MGWMLQLGVNGYSGEYLLPPNAEVQAITTIYEVDVYRESYIFSLLFFYSSFFLSQASEMSWFTIYQHTHMFVSH